MPLTGRDFTSTELEYLNELAGSMGMEPLPGFKPAGQLPGLKSSWGEDFEDPAAAMPFFPTSELISQPKEELLRGRRLKQIAFFISLRKREDLLRQHRPWEKPSLRCSKLPSKVFRTCYRSDSLPL